MNIIKNISSISRTAAVVGIMTSSILLFGNTIEFPIFSTIKSLTPFILLVINAIILIFVFLSHHYDMKQAVVSPNQDVISKKSSELTEKEYADILGRILLSVTQQLKSQIDNSNEYSVALENADNQLRSSNNIHSIDSAINIVLQCIAALKDRTNIYNQKLRSSERKIQHLSNQLTQVTNESLTDPLTGIANRRQFDRQLLQICNEMCQLNAPFTIALIDIDWFKKINDKYGHAVGDQVLIAFAGLIKKAIRSSDFVARIGGEEFAVLLPNTDIKAAEALQARVLQVLKSKNWQIVESNQNLGHITASIGLAQLNPTESIDSLIKRADKALYRAKTDGRACIRTAA